MAIHIAIETAINERRARADVEKLKADYTRAGRDAGDGFGREYARGVERSAPRVTKAYTTYAKALDKVADSQAKARQEAVRHSEVLKTNAADTEKVVRSAERLAKAKRDEAAAMRSARSSHVDYNRSLRNLGDSAGGVEGALRSLGTTLGALGRVGGAVAIPAIAAGIFELGEVAASASKALLLLPAAITGAAAGFGTLKLATMGFGDALDSVRDPKAFAEALQQLSPNAQAAAISIRNLVPAFDGLKNATQDAFFAGLGDEIRNLAQTYMPTIQRLTTGVAGAFNAMMREVSHVLQEPGIQNDISNIVDNVVAAFRNLVPAVAPLTRAFSDLVAVGSDFLPTLATSASNLATEFAGFIREARESGHLHEWLSEGLTTLRELGGLAKSAGELFLSMSSPQVQTDLHKLSDALSEIADNMDRIVRTFDVGKDVFAFVWHAFTGQGGAAFGDLADIFNPATPPSPVTSTGASLGNPALNGLLLPGYVPPGTDAAAGPGVGGGAGAPIPPTVNPGWGPAFLPPGTTPGGGGDGTTTTPTTGYAAPGPMGTQPYMNEIASLASRFGLTPTSGKRNEPGSYHNVGEALDIGGGTPAQMQAFANYMAAEFGNQLQELIYGAPGFTGLIGDRQNVTGTGYYSAKTLSDHLDHVHVAMDGMLDTTKEYGAQLDHMADATRRATDATASYTASQQQLGAQLDQDFGISKGLPGIAENITKFLANLAFAPALGALSAVTDVNGTAGQGSGLLGMLAPRQNAWGTPMPNVLGQYSPEQVQQMWQQLYGGQQGQPGTPSGQPGTPGAGNAAGDPRSIAQQQMAAYGWGPSEWPALNQLWQRESSWDPTATNPDSGAFGIAQFLGHENDQYGAMGGYSPNAASQINAGLAYIANTYGSPSAAWAHWQANNSYDDGGTVPGYGHDPVVSILHPGETVLPTRPGQNPLDVFAPTKDEPNPNVYSGGVPPWWNLPSTTPAPLPPREVAELPTKPAGRYPGQGLNVPHGEGIKPGGGIIGLAESAATSAAGAAGGLGSFGAGGAAAAAAAQIGIDELNRAIQYGGQVAGIAVQGLMETFLPNESPLADIGGGWLGRVAGAVAGVSAATPNLAGAIGQMLQGKPEDQKPPTGDQAPPGTPASGIGLGPPPGPVNSNNQTVNITAANANPNEIAAVATHHLGAMYSGPGR